VEKEFKNPIKILPIQKITKLLVYKPRITRLVPTRPKRIPKRKPLFLPNLAIKKEAGIVRRRDAIIFKETGSVDNDSLPVKSSPINVFVEVMRRLPDCTSARERKIIIRFLYMYITVSAFCHRGTEKNFKKVSVFLFSDFSLIHSKMICSKKLI